MRRTVPSLALLTLLAACGGAADRPLDAAANWRIDSMPLLAIGGEAGDTLTPIGNAVGVAALEDGGVVVADRGYRGLRFFDASGRFVAQVGREGSGPGEYRYIARMWRCGDSLVIKDIERRLYSVTGLDGRVARTYFPGAPAGERFPQPYKEACGPTGLWIANGWDDLPPGELRRARDSVDYWLADRDGQVIVTLGRWPGSERLTGPHGSRPHPLGKEPVMAVGRTRAYLGSADSFRIEAFRLDGTPDGAVTKPSVELAVTEADRARYRLLDTLGKSSDEVERLVREWGTFEFPPTVPAYTALLVDRDDNLWVRTFPRTEANLVRWVIFNPNGKEIGSIDLPVTLEVYEVGPESVLGVETSLQDGAQAVRMYRLHRE